jgi:hypothetical protein
MIHTSMHFLSKNELYSTVKPYSLRFEPLEGFARTNFTRERREDLWIEDARPIIDEFSGDKQGFGSLNKRKPRMYSGA